MASKFIVSHAGQEVGPYSADEIKQMLLANQLSPVDYLYDEHKQDWLLLSDYFDLKALAQEMGAPPHVPNTSNTMYPNLRPDQMPPQASTPSQTAPPVEPETTVLSLHLDNLAEPPPIKSQQTAATAVNPPVKVEAPRVIQIAPPAVATVQAPAAVPVQSQQPAEVGQKVKFNGGVGTVSLKQLRAGRVLIKLQDCSTPDLSLPQETVVNVEAGPAKTITWQAPEQCSAGDEVEIAMVARDAFDNMTSSFNGELALVCKGQKTDHHKANFVSGRASLKHKWTVAETLSLELSDPRDSRLALPAPKTINVLPGPAVRLLVETPPQAVAGDNVPLTVKAVDQFGNIATDFKGEINLAMTLDPSNKAS